MILIFPFLTQAARKPPVSPLKIQKPTDIPVIIESDEEDLSPVLDLTSRKRKQQPNAIDASDQPPAKLPRKRPAALVIQETTPEKMEKITVAQSESDNSSPGVEGDKV
jgi:hypothetical protein